MPSWAIHCAIANKINKYLKVDENVFLFGNILPDINASRYYNSYISHFYGTKRCENCINEELPDIDRFYNVYKDKLDNPLILGYYCHLLTDYYFNDYTYSNHWLTDKNNNIIGIKLADGTEYLTTSNCIIQSLKKKDFIKFDQKLCTEYSLNFPEYHPAIIEHAKLLEPQFINENVAKMMIAQLHNFLNDTSLNNVEYEVFKEEEIEKLLEQTFNQILKTLKEKKIIKEEKRQF